MIRRAGEFALESRRSVGLVPHPVPTGPTFVVIVCLTGIRSGGENDNRNDGGTCQCTTGSPPGQLSDDEHEWNPFQFTAIEKTAKPADRPSIHFNRYRFLPFLVPNELAEPPEPPPK